MHPAGILGHIAADGAGNLRRGIGGVIQAIRCGSFGNGEIAHAGLNHRAAGVGVDVQDLLEARKRQDQPETVRLGATRQTGSSAPRHQGHALDRADLEDFQHLRLGFRQHHHHRHLPQRGHAVAFVGTQILHIVEQARRRHDARQRIHQAGFVHPREIRVCGTESRRIKNLACHGVSLSVRRASSVSLEERLVRCKAVTAKPGPA